MIVSFVVDPEALWDFSGDPALSRSNHRRFIDLWARLGALVYGDGVGPTLDEVIRRIPDQDTRKLWQLSTRRNRKRAVSAADWPVLTATKSVEELNPLAAYAQLACLEPVRAVVFGLPEDETCFRMDGCAIEICRFDAADQSEGFKDAETLSRQSVEVGELAKDVWRTRFMALARFSEQVVVVDPYCVLQHEASLAGGNRGPSGLHRLLTELDATGLPHRVKIFAAADKDGRPDEARAEQLIQAEWRQMARGGVREIELRWGLSNHGFVSVAHDRYVRFDKAMLNLGGGIEVLAGHSVIRRSACSLEPCNGPSDVEKSLLPRTVLIRVGP